MSALFRIMMGIVLAVLSFSPLYASEDDALYFEPPPHGSAFVRFINGDVPLSPLMKINGKSYAAAPPGGIGIYYPTPPGEAKISLGDIEVTSTLKPDMRYDAVQMDGKLLVLEEPANDNKIKTPIFLVNTSGAGDVTLKTADGSVAVIESVKPGTLAMRAVNPMKIGFSVYNGANKIADLEERPLERGIGYAVVVYDDASGKPVVHYDKARQ